ncbi:M48 family metalloprotease [Hymenobacter taeanensis]|uniref:M48 family metalloprotease n=1 Tax=Hymenobacter taeanensis TaxID=2735321 RepID=A0A6M6BEH7_9BACT|nr:MULTISPECIES: M48 family metalloprotease [Hymenobacter]QJX46971.1 M48 family metalloprotease [Hymenobacter taeanensis]UOQ80849.1 M48 family metalloprotease [Hymenobacter sp. 5414T-23]
MKSLVSAVSGLGTALLLLHSGCSTNPVSGKREVSLVSEEQELAMGKEADPQVIAQYGLYENEALQRFVQEKGKQMGAISHRPGLTYQFRVVDSPVINAFAIPGGYIYLTRGIMAHFNNEAQFAGVLGHEIGHVTARHSAQQQTKSTLAQVGLIAGMIASPQFGQYAEQAQQGLGLLFLKFGRDDEREADQLGVEYSSKIGYDAHQMADFFQTLQREQQKSTAEALPPFLSTHPDPGDRYNTVHQLATQWQQKMPATNLQVNRNSYLQMIDGIVYGEDPKQGFLEKGVFYHPVLKFQFPVPTSWKFQNSPQQVQMAPQDGKALMILTLAPGETLEAAAQQMIKQYQLQVVESKSITINGLPALAVVADQVAQQQQQPQQQQQQQQAAQVSARTLIHFIRYGNANYVLLGASSPQDFATYAPQFSSTAQGFRQLTDPDKLNRKPERVRVKTLKLRSNLSQALRSNGVPEARLEEMAILNGMQLNEQVNAGSLIKVVEQ